jgi:glycosyltransferase involved in cell wall biosynthesis
MLRICWPLPAAVSRSGDSDMQRRQSFALVTIGSGDYLGSTVRDISLANALHRRGFKVAVYWMMESKRELVDLGIVQRQLCHGTRYHFQRPSAFLDRVIGPLLFMLPASFRVRTVQRSSGYVDRLLENLVRSLYERPSVDHALAQRLLKFMARDEVSHLVMSFASIGPLALAAKTSGRRPFDYLLTFQGDEQFVAYSRRCGLLAQYLERLNDVLQHSRWPAIAVSQDYVDRIVDEMGVPRSGLQVIYNGIELPAQEHQPPFAKLNAPFPDLREDVPIVTYVGRQDCEKGIDLLLYAARLLAARNIPMQLVICGSTAKGESYRKVLSELTTHLGLSIHHVESVSSQIRDTLYAHSHCVVYPSINREPFGLVVAEAMSHGTPVLVPDYGGITEVIHQDDKLGGLTFRTWDSGDLATQLERLLTDKELYRTLAANARTIAGRFSVEQMTQDVLEHIGICADDPDGTELGPATSDA